MSRMSTEMSFVAPNGIKLDFGAGDHHLNFVPKDEDGLGVLDAGLIGEYAARHEYSPDNENAATSASERDESPDTVSSSPSAENIMETKPFLAESDLQRHLMRLQQLQQQQLQQPKEEPVDIKDVKPGMKIEHLAAKLAAPQQAAAAALAQEVQQHPLGSLGAIAMQLAQPGGLPAPTNGVAAPNPFTMAAANQGSSQFVPSPKRKRQRRNPVWPYFDVIDGVARCKQCAYSTRSVFSTNLKVHLRSHHRADYEKVIEAEDALNLNALLLSGNPAANLLDRSNTRKRSLPPMTSSILMTISKLAGHNSALTAALAGAAAQQPAPAPQTENDNMSVLRQTLAANSLQQLTNQQRNNDIANFQNLANLALARSQFQQAVSQQIAAAQQQQSPTTVRSPLPTPPQNNNNNNSTQSPAESIFSQLALQNMRNGMSTPQQQSGFSSPGTDPSLPQPKRRRLRRHPVWMFFRDLEDRMVGCINCNFRTGSAFSTNLKMHLKAHHKDDYAKVLKLEDDMRIEEGIFGPPNKIKSELIDFIRGGGNASTPVNLTTNTSSAPKASPLVQQIISQTLAGRQQSVPSSPLTQLNESQHTAFNRTESNGVQQQKTNNPFEEESFAQMSMADRLAALVGLVPSQQTETEVPEEEAASEEQGDLLTRLGLLPEQTHPLSINALNAFHNNNSGGSDTKSCTSSSMDGSSIDDNRKSERDRAVAKFFADNGSNEELVASESFKVEEGKENNVATTSSSSTPSTSSPVKLPLGSLGLTPEMLAAALTSFQTTEGVDADTASQTLLMLLAQMNAPSPTKQQQPLAPLPPLPPEAPASLPTMVPQRTKIVNPGNPPHETVNAIHERIREAEKIEDPVLRNKKIQCEKMKLRRLLETPEERTKRLNKMRERYNRDKVSRRSTNPLHLGSPGLRDSSPSLSPGLVSPSLGSNPQPALWDLPSTLAGSISPSLAAALPPSLSSVLQPVPDNSLQWMPPRESSADRILAKKLKNREYQRNRLLNETPEQRERRLSKMRELQRRRRSKQVGEQNNEELLRVFAPEYEVPDVSTLSSMCDSEEEKEMLP